MVSHPTHMPRSQAATHKTCVCLAGRGHTVKALFNALVTLHPHAPPEYIMCGRAQRTYPTTLPTFCKWHLGMFTNPYFIKFLSIADFFSKNSPMKLLFYENIPPSNIRQTHGTGGSGVFISNNVSNVGNTEHGVCTCPHYTPITHDPYFPHHV
jgi:hypothetical protein